MIGVALALLVALSALGAVAVYVVRDQGREREWARAEARSERVAILEYTVPTGQDPAVVLAALEQSGYSAAVDPHHAHQHVRIACPAGVERERAQVRAAIEAAGVRAREDGAPPASGVRFLDE